MRAGACGEPRRRVVNGGRVGVIAASNDAEVDPVVSRGLRAESMAAWERVAARVVLTS
jgi:hypothetical protein